MYDGKSDIFYGNGLIKLNNESFIRKFDIMFNVDGDYDINDRGGILYYSRKIGNTYKVTIFALNNKILDGTIIRYTGVVEVLSAKINNKIRLIPYNLSYKDYTTIETSSGAIHRLDDSISNVGAMISMGDNSKTIAENNLNVFSTKMWPNYRKSNFLNFKKESALTGRIGKTSETRKNIKPKIMRKANKQMVAKKAAPKRKRQVAKRSFATKAGNRRSKY